MKKTPFAICYLLFAIYVGGAYAADNDCMTRKTAPRDVQTLQNIVELGLCRNPVTSAAYLAAESARLSKNAGYAKYLPSVSVSGSAGKNYQNREWDDEWSYGASVSASYLIFDFGKRYADLSALASSWQAAGFDYDESVQNYIYGIIGAYYSLLNADADVRTAESLRTVAQTAKDTADKKFKAGSVARADVLKADTTLATRELTLERAQNDRQIAKGTLLSRLSFSATDEIKIADMPSDFGNADENKSIDELLNTAQKSRPDLLRATANRDAAWHRRNSNFLSNLPTISATGTLSYNDTTGENWNTGIEKTSGSIGIRASMPIFAGFANLYGLRAAEANLTRAKEMERLSTDNASLDVFSAYNNYKTAQTVLGQTETLLKSATESEKVTAGMYRVGRATMLEWQTSQSELADAESQHNAAKYDLYVKRAAVALAIGDIRAELGE